MKGLYNSLYILIFLTSIFIMMFGGDIPGKNKFASICIIISVIGFVITFLFMKDKYKTEKEILYKLGNIASIVLVLFDLFELSMGVIKSKDLINNIQISLGMKQEVVLDSVCNIYTYDSQYKVDFDYKTNNFTVYFNKDGNIKTYQLSIKDITDQKQSDVKLNYHGVIPVNKYNVLNLYGIFSYEDINDSIVTPYIELSSGVYAIEGNQLVIDEVFTKIFNRENIFTNKILTIQGEYQEDGKIKSGVLEEYYTDSEGKYIYNGRRLYKDLYLCNNQATINTQIKLQKYIEFLGLEREKQVSKFQTKEITIGGDVVNKIKLYYYNNLDSLNYIEIIFKGKPDSLIIKESDPKFKFDKIQKLY